MKALIVHPHMSFYGGAETVVANLSMELKKMGVDNSVITLSLPDKSIQLCSEITFITPHEMSPLVLKNASFLTGIKKMLNEISMLHRLVKENSDGFDIINVHNFPATWALLFTGCKNVVWMCNEPPDLWNKESPTLALKILRKIGYSLDRFIVNKVINKICAADEINAERIKNRYRRDVEIVPYGIEYDLFSSGSAEYIFKRYGIEGKFIVVQVGIITPQKNQMESVKAVHMLKKEIPNICLLLAGPVGNNDYQRSIINYIEENRLKEHVHFLGQMPKTDIASIYHAGNAAMFPVKEQGGWLSPFEALCASIPVIVSETMGAASIIKRENIGVAANDYAGAILDIYRNPDTYKEMAKKGKEWVSKNLTWSIFANRKYKIFENLLNEKGGFK